MLYFSRAARGAFDSGPWSPTGGHERARTLLAVADLIERDAEEIAYRETVDMRKPIIFAGQEVPFVAMAYRYFAGLARQPGGATRPTATATFTYTLREPVGVVSAGPVTRLHGRGGRCCGCFGHSCMAAQVRARTLATGPVGPDCRKSGQRLCELRERVVCLSRRRGHRLSRR
ncbi:aldehyde dehydrogenase family protein [Streptomyces carpinensis]|uniref:Aldehyde dehydrogenase family protein n=1 Tax=Streptomyces carpinensis TaxID=66369 RepID=A0ABV1W6P7_9ACTN|nr:aldehyde dehydrogenase family protein [Streptomyces carpinensis]